MTPNDSRHGEPRRGVAIQRLDLWMAPSGLNGALPRLAMTTGGNGSQ
jgi:hypothetical protein